MHKIITILALLLASCSSITPYKIDVQQGNVITQDMVAKLKPGMTKPQVRFILGTPLLMDTFHANRWDYVYLFDKAGKLQEKRKFTVIFENDLLKRVEGDVVAATPEELKAAQEKASATPMESTAPDAKGEQKNDPPEADKKEEKGFFGRMLEKIGL